MILRVITSHGWSQDPLARASDLVTSWLLATSSLALNWGDLCGDNQSGLINMEGTPTVGTGREDLGFVGSAWNNWFS